MRSPHESGGGAYQDYFPEREIYEQEERLIGMGYKFLGWNFAVAQTPESIHCVDAGHRYHSAFPNAWKVVLHTPSGSDATQWCTICRIYWKVDMS